MKKLLLILLCLPMIGFGQLYHQLDSVTSDSMTYSFKYNTKGRCTEMLMVDANNPLSGPGPFAYPLKYKFFYDSNNNFYYSRFEYVVNQIDSLWIEWFGTYDSSNILFKDSIYEHDSQIGIRKGYYYYDGNGDMIRSERFALDSNVWIWSQKSDFTYQSGCLFLDSTYGNFNNGSTPTSSDLAWRKEYFYSSGNLDSVNSVSCSPNQDAAPSVKYFYNNLSLNNTAFCFPVLFTHLSLNQCMSNQITQHIEYNDNTSTNTIYNYHYSPWGGGISFIHENLNSKKLVRTIDILGRETKGKKNEPLFYIYDDGTVEKRIVIE